MKQVILVRKDLNMSAGKAAAQCCHASLSAYLATNKAHQTDANKWLADGQTKIILLVESEEELVNIHAKVTADKNLAKRVSLIRDAGHTELKGQNLTTLGIGPCKAADVDKYTGALKLYK